MANQTISGDLAVKMPLHSEFLEHLLQVADMDEPEKDIVRDALNDSIADSDHEALTYRMLSSALNYCKANGMLSGMESSVVKKLLGRIATHVGISPTQVEDTSSASINARSTTNPASSSFVDGYQTERKIREPSTKVKPVETSRVHDTTQARYTDEAHDTPEAEHTTEGLDNSKALDNARVFHPTPQVSMSTGVADSKQNDDSRNATKVQPTVKEVTNNMGHLSMSRSSDTSVGFVRTKESYASTYITKQASINDDQSDNMSTVFTYQEAGNNYPVGASIMMKQGWKQGQGLGPRGKGIKKPIATGDQAHPQHRLPGNSPTGPGAIKSGDDNAQDEILDDLTQAYEDFEWQYESWPDEVEQITKPMNSANSGGNYIPSGYITSNKNSKKKTEGSKLWADFSKNSVAYDKADQEKRGPPPQVPNFQLDCSIPLKAKNSSQYPKMPDASAGPSTSTRPCGAARKRNNSVDSYTSKRSELPENFPYTTTPIEQQEWVHRDAGWWITSQKKREKDSSRYYGW
ncbi:uncharacterized protein BCR38DRAFT_408031 [Pseudomassariella vexata]|uniref:G-patch domain-containing protein n=1 Tax=Pseudomassariella vexata TaxID=1141098 RepID=A0A1Y2E437_9PEZI|nr:uncharacterized protein BCR38DRAFT_408031 [Pseudomassariella vexata]ORY66056.1 hypothetical protein BCR38DRAFT_408031 [Pseudomassariella vexata]